MDWCNRPRADEEDESPFAGLLQVEAACPEHPTRPNLVSVMRQADKAIIASSDTGETLTAIKEADRLLAALSGHEAHELPEARTQLEEALKLEAAIYAIRADAAAGRLAAERAETRIGVIRASVATARARLEDAERLSVELRRRIAEAGRTAVDATLADARGPLAEAARAQEQAKELLEQRRSEYELALAPIGLRRDGGPARAGPPHVRARQVEQVSLSLGDRVIALRKDRPMFWNEP